MTNLANILTIARLLLLPVIVWLIFIPESWAAWSALGLYVIGAVTDWLDGWVARKFDQISDFGIFLDPISDKIYVSVILLALVAVDHIQGIWLIPIMVIFTREFLVSGLREYLGPKNIKLPVTKLAKWKTTIQLIAPGFLIVGPYQALTLEIGLLLLTLAAILTVITGWGYMKAGLDHMGKSA